MERKGKENVVKGALVLAILAFSVLLATGCDSSTNPGDDVEKDKAKEYTVTFDSDGGNYTPAAQTVKENETAKVPEPPTKTGFDFVAWCITGTNDNFDFATKITKNIALKAKWEKSSKWPLEYDFANADSFVEGTDYETAGGSWKVEDGKLYFDMKDADAKLKFLKSADMTNSIIEMDITVETLYGANGTSGNGGLVHHMDRIGPAGDQLDGYYVGAGNKEGRPNYHFESAWFGFDSGWHALNNDEETNIPYSSTEQLRLVVTVINNQSHIEVYNQKGDLTRELDGNTYDQSGDHGPDSGFAGIRVWNCAGWIDNVKILSLDANE